jgi:hypothetical protein
MIQGVNYESAAAGIISSSDSVFWAGASFRLKKISNRWIVPLSSYLVNIIQS